jgi:hypothetical protein
MCVCLCLYLYMFISHHTFSYHKKKPALDGKARTTVLVTASPDKCDGDETVHSLRFGERCGEVAMAKSGGRDLINTTASMAEVLKDLTRAIKSSLSRLEELAAQGGKEQVDK